MQTDSNYTLERWIWQQGLKLKLTLEQHRLELHRSTFTDIFFPQEQILQYSAIHNWICGYRWLTIKLYTDFHLCGVCVPLAPALFKGQLEHVYMCIYTYMYMYICIHVCIYMYICTNRWKSMTNIRKYENFRAIYLKYVHN